MPGRAMTARDGVVLPPPLPSPAVEAGAVPSLARRIVVGSAWMVGGRVAMRGISVVSTLILVRLLVPEDFGIIGLAAAAFTVAEVLTGTNFGAAVVRRQAADRAFYDTAWTLNLLRCLLLGGVVAATAPWQAALLGDPRVGPILMVVAFSVMLDGLTSAGVFRLQRELRFERVFRLQILYRVASFAATVALAVALGNYWCLVLGNLAAKALSLPYSYWLAPHRPRLSLAAARDLLHFSKWMLAFNLCSAVDGQAANLTLGRLVGLRTLGLWQTAYQVAAVPITELAVPIREPIYAGYANAQGDPGLLRRHFLGGVGLLCAIVTPLSVGIALTAPEVQRLALGPAFAGAAPLIAFCALWALVDALAHFTFNLFIVLDKMRRLVATYAALVLVRIPAVVAGALLAGAEGVGVALVATALLNAAVWHAQVARLLGYGLGAVWAEVWRSLAAAAVMAAAVLALRPAVAALPAVADGGAGGAALSLAVLAAAGACAHIGAQLLLWRLCGAPAGAERRLVDTAARLRTQLRPRPAAPAR